MECIRKHTPSYTKFCRSCSERKIPAHCSVVKSTPVTNKRKESQPLLSKIKTSISGKVGDDSDKNLLSREALFSQHANRAKKKASLVQFPY